MSLYVYHFLIVAYPCEVVQQIKVALSSHFELIDCREAVANSILIRTVKGQCVHLGSVKNHILQSSRTVLYARWEALPDSGGRTDF